MSAAKRAKKKEAPAPPQQIPGLSFSLKGQAFRNPDFLTQHPIYLLARRPSSKPFGKILEGLDKAKDPDTPKSRLALPLTEEEQSDVITDELHRYVMVGWIPQTGIHKNFTKQSGILGTKAPNDENEIITYDPDRGDELPLIAVVQVVAEERDTSVLSYALLEQKNGICTPYVAAQPEIFYLSIFRSNSTASKTRAKEWNEMVMKFALQKAAQATAAQGKTLKLQRAKDQTKLVLPPAQSLSNEIAALVSAYKLGKDSWCLDELKAVLEEIDNDLTMAPPQNTAIRAFSDLTDEESEEFTETDAKSFVKEAAAAWYGVAPLNAEHILLLAHGMRRHQMPIDYWHIQPFVLEAIHQLKQAFANGEIDEAACRTMLLKEHEQTRLAEIVQTAADTTERILGYCPQYFPTPPEVKVEETMTLLRTIKAKLRDAVTTDVNFTRMLKDAAGDEALDCNYQDIWNRYSDAADTDSAKVAFMDVVKLLIVQFRKKEEHLGDLVSHIVDILDKAGV